MQFLGEITDSGLGLPSKKTDYRLRRAARAVIVRGDKVALIHVVKDGYYKIPGGGVDEGESVEQALHREVKEESGCDVLVDGPVGFIVEVRDFHNLIHLSYCYLCHFRDEGATCLTQEELAAGFKPVWVDIDEAVRLIESSKTPRPTVKFMVRRDALFLRKAKELLS